MPKRKKFKTGERATLAHRKADVPSSSEFVAQRKEDALALAQLAYDMFVEQEAADAEAEGQNNAQ
ncbi:MAG TPA: hypothetical protein VFN56_04300 [Candidatus Saccharimonadales bacterium]|nr:hypothetical protein [Candidatus Saccharimonadales bacterium]